MRICATRTEVSARKDDAAGFGEWRTYGGVNFGAAEALPNALENCRVCRGRAGIVAKQNGQGVGIGPDDRNGFDRRFQRQRVVFVLQ